MNIHFKTEQSGYLIPLGLSILLHSFVFALLFMNLIFISKPKSVSPISQPVKIVEATQLDQQKVEAEINRIKHAELMKRKQEEERVKQLERKAAQAKQKEAVEKKKLAELQKAKKLLEQKQLAEQKLAEKKLAELKEKQKLEEEKIKKTQEAVAQAAIQKKKEEEKKAKLAKEEELRKEKELAMEQERLQQEEKLLAEQLAEEQAKTKAVAAKQMQTQIDKYTAMITQAVGQHWIVPDNVGNEISCVLLIRVAPGGSVVDVKLLRSSGDPVLDRSAIAAVNKASPLPVPEDPKLFKTFREIRLLVRPEGYLS